MQSNRHIVRMLYLFAAAALLLRLVAIDHGFPDIDEEATPVRQAWEMWGWEKGSIDFNPGFFNYPALAFYVNWIVQAGYRLATETSGLRQWGPSDTLPLDLVLIGRLLSILFAAGISWCTYRLGRRLMPKLWAVWAAVFVFWMPTLFRYSILSVVDLPLALLSILVLAALARPPTNELRRHLWIGLLIGLSASSKYTGLFLAVPYVVWHLSLHQWDVRAALLSSRPWLAGLLTVLTFFAINPYIILDYDTFYWNYAFERQHMALGHFGRLNSPLSEYGWTLWLNIGPLALIGIVAAATQLVRSAHRAQWLPSLVFTLFYPCFLIAWATSFGHYLLPIFPILVLLAIQGLRILIVGARRHFTHRILKVALPLLSIAPLIVSTQADFTHIREPSPRNLAKEWFATSAPENIIIAAEPGGPTLPATMHEVLIPMHTTDPGQSTPVYAAKWYEPIDMLLVVESVESRYLSQPSLFPDQVHFYDQIEADWELAQRFGRAGLGIRVYRNPVADRGAIKTYPDSLYRRLSGMSRVLSGRFLDRLGSAYRDAGRHLFAVDVYNKLTTNHPDEQDYTLAFADVLLSIRQKEAAIRLLESRRKTGDDHLKASLHYLRAEYDSAAAAWARYAESLPGNAKVRLNLARLLLAMGKHEEALGRYLEAIEVGVNDVGVYLQACALLRKLGEPTLAGKIALAGLAKWPKHKQLRTWAQDANPG
jgi:4-amino-4-deoxy-L-arabinose transferase-like glycosyltransferase